MSEKVAEFEEGMVVNVDHLMQYVKEMREEGGNCV